MMEHQKVLSLIPMYQNLMFLAKVISYWLFTIIPLVIIGFLANYLLTSNMGASIVLLISLLLGTLTISLIGSIAASLTLSIKGNNLLLSSIVLPLDIPVLIFGTSSVYNAMSGVDYNSELLFLLLLLILFLIISPFASAMGLKNSLDQFSPGICFSHFQEHCFEMI